MGEAPSKGPRPPAYDLARIKAQEAAIEQHFHQYVLLTCGHYTDRETDELFSTFRVTGGTLYCVTCEDFVPVVKRKYTTEYPSEPPF